MSNTHTAPKFRKINAGLYGTGITCRLTGRWEYLCTDCCEEVELVIDRWSMSGGWQLRHRCEHDHFTDWAGEIYATLRDAKADITDRRTA